MNMILPKEWRAPVALIASILVLAIIFTLLSSS